MKYSICIETFFTSLPFFERVERAREAGFRAIEFYEWRSRRHLLDRIEKRVKENDIEVIMFAQRKGSLLHPSGWKTYLNEVRESIPIAHRLGCNKLMLLTDGLTADGRVANTYDRLTNEEKHANIVAGLQQVAELGCQEGILFLLELCNPIVDHPGYYLCSTERGARVIDDVGSEHVKLLYDLYHMQIAEGNLINNLRRYINRIAHIHGGDAPGRGEPGTGEINFANIFRTLVELKYEGYVCFEGFPTTTDQEALYRYREVFPVTG